jgi:Tfp pilus assembly protein PilF
MTAATLSPDELLALARQRMQHGDWRGAENFVAMVLEKFPARADAWSLFAQLAWQKGDTAATQHRAQQCLALAPDDPLARTLRGCLSQQAITS